MAERWPAGGGFGNVERLLHLSPAARQTTGDGFDMSTIARASLAVVAGLVTWILVATVGNLAIRGLLPGYAAVEKAMDFTLAMQVARLALGAASSLAAGAVCRRVAPTSATPVYFLAVVLVLMFIPVHISLWAKFPVWYHLVFLGSLPLLTWLGGRRSGQVDTHAS